jgi:hypothetical protein
MTYIAEKTTVPTSTCSQCTHFQDFHEPNGRGWCHLFEQSARQTHQRTNDCDLHAQVQVKGKKAQREKGEVNSFNPYPLPLSLERSELDPLDAPHSRFAVESVVKIIDPDEHHTEWAAFVVIGRQYNTGRYRSTESYLNEPEWYYQLANMEYEETFEPLWVADNEICAFDESHNICTEDIF